MWSSSISEDDLNHNFCDISFLGRDVYQNYISDNHNRNKDFVTVNFHQCL